MGNSRSRCMHGLGPLSSACMAVVCKEMNVASDHRLGQGPQMANERKIALCLSVDAIASTTVLYRKGGLQCTYSLTWIGSPNGELPN